MGARFGGRSRWFKGKITKENSDGTFDILYNDGDRERKVKKDLIRSLEKNDSDNGSGSGSGSDSDAAELDVGSKVEARFGGRSRWFKGKITRKNSDGTFDILYNDGDRERKVKKDLIRPLDGGGKSSSKSRSKSRSKKKGKELKLKKGMEIEARYRGHSKWVKGKITSVNRDYIGDNDDTYDIKYETGYTERKVKKEMIRAVGGDDSA